MATLQPTSLVANQPYRFGESFCNRYNQLHHHVHEMPMELKRKITQFNHVADCSEHLFLPPHGITLGEYNILYFLIYSGKRKDYQTKSVEKASHNQAGTGASGAATAGASEVIESGAS